MTTSSSNILQTRLHEENIALKNSVLGHTWSELDGHASLAPAVGPMPNHPRLAEALEKLRDSVSGKEFDRHLQEKSSLSAQYLVELVESILKVVRQDLGGVEHSQTWLHPQLDRHASGFRAAYCAQILGYHECLQRLSNPSLFVHVERDAALLVHTTSMCRCKPLKRNCLNACCFSRRTMESPRGSSI